MTRTLRCVALAVALCVGIAGCVAGGGETTPEHSGEVDPHSEPRDLIDAIAERVPLDEAGDRLLRLLLQDVPVDDDVMAAIRGAGAQIDAIAAGASEAARAAPQGFRSSGTSTGSPLGTTTQQGLTTVAVLVGTAVDRAVRGRPVGSDDPSRRVDLTDGRLEASVDASAVDVQGDVTATLTTETTVDVMLCPDATGKVSGDIDSHVTLDLVVGAGTYRSGIDLDLTFEATADDDATRTTLTQASTGAFTETASGSADGRTASAGVYAEVATTSAVDVGGGEWTLREATGRTIRASRHSSAAHQRALQEVQATLATMIANTVTEDAERYWRSGACVEVRLTPSDGPTDLEPGQRVDIDIDPVSKIDGAPTGGDVVTELVDGGDAVTPAGTELAAPTSVSYNAPDDGGGTVEAVATSRRGVGRNSLRLETGSSGWVVSGSDGVFDVAGVKCGEPGGTWSLSLSAYFDGGSFTGEVIAELDPDTLVGSYDLTGTWSGGPVTLPQRGTGPIRFVVEGPDSGRLEFESTGWTSGAAGGGRQGVGSVPARPAGPDDC